MSGQLGELVISLQADIARFREDMGKANRVAQESATTIAKTFDSASNGIQRSMDQIRTAVAAIGLATLGRSMLDAGLQMEKMGKLFSAATGDAGAGARELEYVRAVSDRMGLSFATTSESYGRFLAAIRDTTLEGEKGRKVFESVAAASTALGLRADETSGIFNALQQMMSKGKVQAEELRGQLGERLPGAFAMAAKAMGVTTAELDKMLADGKVLAGDLLPKLAVELDKTYGKAAVDGAKSAQSEINRLGAAMLDLKSKIIEGETFAAGFKAATTAAKTLGENLDVVAVGLAAITGAAMISGITALTAGITALGGAITLANLSSLGTLGAVGVTAGASYGLASWAVKKADKALYKSTGFNLTGETMYDEANQRDMEATARLNAALEKKRQNAITSRPAPAPAKSEAEIAQAEAWRKTYADLGREIEKLNPALDEYAQKTADVANKYDDLMGKKGADISKLKALRAEMMQAIDTRKAYDEALAQNKIEMDEYKASQEAMEAAEKNHWLEIAETIKTIEGLQPDFGLDTMNSKISEFTSIADQFPDMADKAAVAIEKLREEFTGFDPNYNGIAAMADELNVIAGINKDLLDLQIEYSDGLVNEKKLRDSLLIAQKAQHTAAISSLTQEIQLQQRLNEITRKQLDDSQRKGVLTGSIVGYSNEKVTEANPLGAIFAQELDALRYISDKDLISSGNIADAADRAASAASAFISAGQMMQDAASVTMSAANLENTTITGFYKFANPEDAYRDATSIVGAKDPTSIIGAVDFMRFLPNGGARAKGGPVSANQSYLVGENGPELFMSSSSGTIIPNDRLSNASQASSAPVTVHGGININLPNITAADDYPAIARGVMAELKKFNGWSL